MARLPLPQPVLPRPAWPTHDCDPSCDPAVLRQAKTRLPDTRIEGEVADQLPRLAEATDVADRRDDPGCHDRVHARNRQKAAHLSISASSAAKSSPNRSISRM
jgi:hypothetical protein